MCGICVLSIARVDSDIGYVESSEEKVSASKPPLTQSVGKRSEVQNWSRSMRLSQGVSRLFWV